MIKMVASFIVLFTALNGLIAQQPGDLDSTFGINGIVTTHFQVGDEAYDVAIQPDGKIVAAGTASGNPRTWALARYNPDGSLDNTFGSGGKVTTFFDSVGFAYAYAVAIQQDGKIIAVGRSHPDTLDGAGTLARYNPDGTLDSTFGVGGKVFLNYWEMGAAWDVALQPDGRIVVAGGAFSNPALFRCNADGSSDSTFGTNGSVVEIGFHPANAMVIQPDGKIVSTGPFEVTRHNPDGTVDSTFGNNGIASTFLGSGQTNTNIALQPDGKIVIAGVHGTSPDFDFSVARLNSDGTFDLTFGDSGRVIVDVGIVDVANSVAVMPDGRIVLAGRTGPIISNADFAVVRCDPDGTLDNTFGNGGKVITAVSPADDQAQAVAIQSDRKIVVVGRAWGTFYDFAVVRYLPGFNLGVIDLSYTNNSALIYPNPIEETATLEYTLAEDETITIELMDMQGKTVTTFIEAQRQNAREHQQLISLQESLPSGSYLVVISSPSGSVSVQVVK